MECFKCGDSGDKVLLSDAISQKGIVKICRKCSFEEDLPMIRKPNEFQIKKMDEPKGTVYERLSKFAGINPRDRRIADEKEAEIRKQNRKLKEISERNVMENAISSGKMDGLADNFHWVIMRARRARKLTQGQLAEKLKEPELLIKLAEKGIVSDGKYDFVKKLEDYLSIKILKENDSERSFEQETELMKNKISKNAEKEDFKFNETVTKTLTVSDLKDVKEKDKTPLSSGRKKSDFTDEKNKSELTSKEIDDLIFGKG